MEQEIKLLEAVVKCSEMGQGTLDPLADVNENGVFADTMRIQRGEYESIREEASRMLLSLGEDPGQLSAFEKLSTAVGIKMNTLTDKSARHMAEMLIQGSTMGIVDLTKAIRDNPGAGEPHIVWPIACSGQCSGMSKSSRAICEAPASPLWATKKKEPCGMKFPRLFSFVLYASSNFLESDQRQKRKHPTHCTAISTTCAPISTTIESSGEKSESPALTTPTTVLTTPKTILMPKLSAI